MRSRWLSRARRVKSILKEHFLPVMVVMVVVTQLIAVGAIIVTDIQAVDQRLEVLDQIESLDNSVYQMQELLDELDGKIKDLDETAEDVDDAADEIDDD